MARAGLAARVKTPRLLRRATHPKKVDRNLLRADQPSAPRRAARKHRRNLAAPKQSAAQLATPRPPPTRRPPRAPNHVGPARAQKRVRSSRRRERAPPRPLSWPSRRARCAAGKRRPITLLRTAVRRPSLQDPALGSPT